MGNDRGRPAGASYLPTLDGWRAVAITAVLVCHGLDPRVHPFAIQLGYAGVLLFFALSGFLITFRLREELAATATISLKDFYLRRAFRILPPALFYLGVITALGLLGAIPFSAVETLKSLLFIRNYAPLNFSNPASWFSVHFWSLSVEEHFYLLWPAALLLVGLRRARWMAPVLALAVVVWRSLDETHQFMADWLHAPSLSHNFGRTDYLADVLLWGCTIALWLGPRPWKSILPRRTTSLACAGILALIGFGFVASGMGHGRYLVYFVVAWLVGFTVTDPASVVGRILELAPLRYIGRLSYSLYLWQELFFHVDREALWFQRFPLNLAFIFACACASYYFIELPAIRLGRRVIGRDAAPVRVPERGSSAADSLAV